MSSQFEAEAQSHNPSVWRGTIIDAHSQFGCEISAAEISAIIGRHGVAHTLLSARGCYREDPLESQLRVLKLVADLKGLASFLISTKLADMGLAGGYSAARGLEALFRADETYFGKAVGFAEILVQHAPHDTPNLRYEGLSLDLESNRIKKSIALALGRKVPVILHLELNDFEDQSAKILGQLKDLLDRNPDGDFVLIHMAQSSVSEARELIENYKNIHFLTTAADAIAAAGIETLRRKKHTAQVGWINMFNDPPKGAPYRGWLADYLPTLKWRDEWKRLIEAHPDRFIFAMDNVFGSQWKKVYGLRLKIWRKALSQLPEETAREVGCANAERLWKLNVECKACR